MFIYAKIIIVLGIANVKFYIKYLKNGYRYVYDIIHKICLEFVAESKKINNIQSIPFKVSESTLVYY